MAVFAYKGKHLGECMPTDLLTLLAEYISLIFLSLLFLCPITYMHKLF